MASTGDCGVPREAAGSQPAGPIPSRICSVFTLKCLTLLKFKLVAHFPTAGAKPLVVLLQCGFCCLPAFRVVLAIPLCFLSVGGVWRVARGSDWFPKHASQVLTQPTLRWRAMRGCPHAVAGLLSVCVET